MPVIFHLDLDSFFVSAERLKRPELRGKCVAVGGTGPRGVISSASYEARKFGVRSAQPTAQALRLCPQLIVVKGSYELYSELSRKVFAIVEKYAPIHERVSVDEGYLDMTGTTSLYGPPVEAAKKIRAEILATTGLTCSIGIASNRMVAKVASDACKPDNFLHVEEGKEAEFLAPKPVRVLPGVGPSTEEALKRRAIFRIGDLQRLSLSMLEAEFGDLGAWLHRASRGQGSTTFHEEAKSHSISRETTFHRDIFDPYAARHELWKMCAEVGRQLREEEAYARVVKLKLRYPPFETVFRSKALQAPAQHDLALYEAACQLLDLHWEAGKGLRLLGVGCSVGSGQRQFGLFEDVQRLEKLEKLDRLKDQLAERFGEGALKTGKDLEPS